MQALEQLYQQSPTAAIILGVLFIVVVFTLVMWVRDLRGTSNWRPHTPYEPPRPHDQERDRTRKARR